MMIDGKELRITPGSMAEAMALLRAITSAVTKSGIDLGGMDVSQKISEMEISEDSFGNILRNILDVATDRNVENCLFACAARAALGTEKINMDFFEKIENRKHYYPIMFEIARVNLSPFFENLGSMLPDITEKIKSYQK